MKLLGKAVRAMAIALALVGGSIATKPAKADGGAVVAGIAGGLILGTIIGSTANANNYYSSAPRYYAPAPIYRPYYGPTVSFNIGSGYYGGHRYYGHKRHYRKYRGHGYRKYRGHRRGYRHHRRYHH